MHIHNGENCSQYDIHLMSLYDMMALKYRLTNQDWTLYSWLQGVLLCCDNIRGYNTPLDSRESRILSACCWVSSVHLVHTP